MGIISVANSNNGDHFLSLFSRLLDCCYQIRFYSNIGLERSDALFNHYFLKTKAFMMGNFVKKQFNENGLPLFYVSLFLTSTVYDERPGTEIGRASCRERV